MPDHPSASAPQARPDTSAPPTAEDLVRLRAEIDALDDAMHDLLMRRAAVVARMARSGIKSATGSFRPGREALIMRRLIGRHRGPLPTAAVLRVWREVIASSHAQQGSFSVAAVEGANGGAVALARGHFGLDTPLRAHPTAARALAALSGGEASVAVLPAPEEGENEDAAWWLRLDAPRLRVVAALPFLCAPGRAAPAALVVAASAPEPTGRDRTLLRIEKAPDASRAALAAALVAAGLPPIRVTTPAEPPHGAPRRALAEVEGFLDPADPRLATLRAELIGAHAEPEAPA